MFKIHINRENIDTGKIKGITITHGYYCRKAYCCNCGKKCKYRKNFTYHNFSVSVHRFFEYRLHIKLPHLLYIHKFSTDLSGTTRCPFGKSRAYSCHDCVHCGGELLRDCFHPERSKMSLEEIKKTSEVDDKDWGNLRCTLFEKTSWADNYDKDTGKMKF